MSTSQNRKHFNDKLVQRVFWSILALTLVFAAGNAKKAAADEFSIIQIGPGAYIHYGAHEEMVPENHGDIGNTGFIIGKESVAVIDTGGSPKVGEEVYKAIRKLTQLPIRYVILTHVHPDHILGTPAFLGEKPELIGHENLPNAIAMRRDFYIPQMRERLGAAGENIVMVTPTLTVPVNKPLELDLGERKITIRAHRPAHTDNDITVFDHKTKTLWFGDLLFHRHIPTIDGSIVGWDEVMDTLENMDMNLAVPGHGEASPDWPGIMSDQRRYITTVLTEVREMIEKGSTMQDAAEQVGHDEKDKWLLYDVYHKGNVIRAFSELEWE